MADKYLVIVESPTKAKTISKFLNKEFNVKACNGHVRDLPNNAAEVPAKLKKEKWAKIGVNVEENFEPLYVIPERKKDHVKMLKEALKGATELYLATDEDREGESISWHLLETLNPKVPVKRLVFHEITKKAIEESLNSPREVDLNLVKAQETRRIIDRLFGYEVSPLLWKKMAPKLSAGRVQSVSVKLLVERERERIKFKSAQYWSLKAQFHKQDSAKDVFDAELVQVGDKRVAVGKDFDPNTGKLEDPSKVAALNQDQIDDLLNRIKSVSPKVTSVEEKPYTTRPSAPFVTSSLQQEANRKLRSSAKRTMSVAQQLYENGFITYMRTDSTTLSDEAINAARTFIQSDYGANFLPDKPRLYATKVKNAQEAHEAIRPAGSTFTPPEVVREKLGDEAFKLYELIWKRTVASQMKDATGTHISVSIEMADARFRASGKTIIFPGFLRAYVEGSDDPDADLADQEKILPPLKENETVTCKELEKTEKTTQAPARYTEGSLIKELERLGIGRPSTWASIVELVLSRDYAFKKGTALVPSFTAMAVVSLLDRYFTHLLDYKFTARLEDDLDAISRGESDNLGYLKEFYFGNGHPGLSDLVKSGGEKIDPREVCGLPLGKTSENEELEVRIGRYGPFISNGTDRASLPDLICPDELTIEKAVEILNTAKQGPASLGNDPETGLPIYLKTGRFGPYLQLGENSDDPRPKMASLLPNILPTEVTLEIAVKLLSLPRTLGNHPETKEEVVAANGRYGPYVKCGKETRSINLDEMSPLDITLEQALALLKEPKRRGRQSTPKSLRELGNHPVSEKPLLIKSGRYGPYVTDGEINASLRKGMLPESLTMEDAVNLLEDRARKIAEDPPKKKSTRKKAAPKAKTTKTKAKKSQ
jgi:DNA topoisomerase-1